MLQNTPARRTGGTLKEAANKLLIPLESDGTLASLLGKHIKTDRFIRTVVNSFLRTPKLAECNQASLLRCILGLAELKLEPDTPQALCHLVPYGNECSLVLGYRGLIELAERAGTVKSVRTVVVREGDDFVIVEGTEPALEHRPSTDASRSDSALTHVYCVTVNNHGETTFTVMDRAQLEGFKQRAKAKKGPWFGDANQFEEMCRKTALRRHYKTIRTSTEFREAEIFDDEQYSAKATRKAAAPEAQDAAFEMLHGEKGEEPPESAKAQPEPPKRKRGRPKKKPAPPPEPSEDYLDKVDPAWEQEDRGAPPTPTMTPEQAAAANELRMQRQAKAADLLEMVLDIGHPDDREAVDAAIAGCLEQGTITQQDGETLSGRLNARVEALARSLA